jgi:hypothetical protein
MQNENLIPAELCCTHYNIDLGFIQTLDQYGLIHVVSAEQTKFIDAEELQTLEKFIRMHYELDINMQGIEAINFLLERVHNMQDEIAYLKSKLNVYEQKMF